MQHFSNTLLLTHPQHILRGKLLPVCHRRGFDTINYKIEPFGVAWRNLYCWSSLETIPILLQVVRTLVIGLIVICLIKDIILNLREVLIMIVISIEIHHIGDCKDDVRLGLGKVIKSEGDVYLVGPFFDGVHHNDSSSAYRG